MALSLGNSHGWPLSNVAQAPVPAASSAHAHAPSPAAPASSHLEAREGPAPAQWQAVKEEIRVLYEKKPLRDVRRILEQRHGFRATYVHSNASFRSTLLLSDPSSHLFSLSGLSPMLI